MPMPARAREPGSGTTITLVVTYSVFVAVAPDMPVLSLIWIWNVVGRLRPDVVLVDVNLPDGTGVDVVRQLSPLLPDTEFVMLTIYQDGDILFDALSAGAHGYLIKPVRADQLLEAIHDVLEGGAPMSNVVARKIVRSFEPDKSLPKPEPLGPREREVLELLATGAMYKQVARKLDISINTVLTHIRRIYKKLHVNSRHAAVDRYRKMR